MIKKSVMPGMIYMTNIALRTQMKCNSKNSERSI